MMHDFVQFVDVLKLTIGMNKQNFCLLRIENVIYR